MATSSKHLSKRARRGASRSSGTRKTSSKRSYSSKGKEKVEKKALKARDKKRPKRALGPYMYFCKDQRKEVQEQNPNMSFCDIGRVLGSQWGRLNEKEKQKYVRKAQTDKRRYDKEMKRYNPRF